MEKRAGTCQATAKHDGSAAARSEWRKLGVRALDGALLPKAEQNGALVSGASRHFLVYDNYDALLAYNCAHAYALSVALRWANAVSPPVDARGVRD